MPSHFHSTLKGSLWDGNQPGLLPVVQGLGVTILPAPATAAKKPVAFGGIFFDYQDPSRNPLQGQDPIWRPQLSPPAACPGRKTQSWSMLFQLASACGQVFCRSTRPIVEKAQRRWLTASAKTPVQL